MIPKNIMASPLSCCIPTGDRQNLNPVFKQQYMTEGGHIKMKMPISPMHYITNAAFYGHDDRFQVRPEHHYQYYNEQMHHNPRNYEYEYKNDVNKRIITPSVSFITQPRRNLSAQIVDPRQKNQSDMNQILRTIDEKLSRIEFICKNNEEEIKELIEILKNKEKVEVTFNEVKTRLVPKEKIEEDRNKGLMRKEQEDSKATVRIEKAQTNDPRNMNTKNQEVRDKTDTKEGRKEKLLSHNSLLKISPEIVSKVDDKIFELSEELKNSNDILERYIRGVKFDEMENLVNLEDLENKMEVLSGDFDTSQVFKKVEDPDSGKDNQQQGEEEEEEDKSLLSNIETKFKKLFSRLDSKSTGEGSKDLQRSYLEDQKSKESLAVLDPAKIQEKTPKEESLKVLSQEPRLEESQDTNSSLKLTNLEMIKLLKGIDLESKIRDANLTVNELTFLKVLNNSAKDSDSSNQERISQESKSEGHSSTDSENAFRCDLLPPTRVDFAPLLIEDSIHGLNSSSFG